MISFIIAIQSQSDIITNSSSEIFMLQPHWQRAHIVQLFSMLHLNSVLDDARLDELKDATVHNLFEYLYKIHKINPYPQAFDTNPKIKLCRKLGWEPKDAFSNFDIWDPDFNGSGTMEEYLQRRYLQASDEFLAYLRDLPEIQNRFVLEVNRNNIPSDVYDKIKSISDHVISE